MKKPAKVEPTPPYWKMHIPKCPERTEWKRDEHGYPIFHDDGICTVCNGKAETFSHPWYKFKFQILGYCEACVITKMGTAPTPEQEAAHCAAAVKKAAPKFPQFLWPDTALIREMEKIVEAI
ncbi:hypothetical protein EKK58_00360 [Candidatus Dependentiae bacterium]|nr:MAG: hypothetical protein EKK58_00360 [Candidatus Dependentiae bacterium]